MQYHTCYCFQRNELLYVSASLKSSKFSLQTDTSSVLKEAMEYIGFLHKQVKVWPFLLHYAEFIFINILVTSFIHNMHALYLDLM